MKTDVTAGARARAYRKKPVVIEAVQWTGDNIDSLRDWGAPVTLLPASSRPGLGAALIIGTLEDGPNCEAVHVADPLDWIIRGIKGEFYPCKPDIFAATYEPADAAALSAPVGVLSDRPWETDRQAGQVTCHSLVIGGVLCRWWGEAAPPGAALLSNLLARPAEAPVGEPTVTRGEIATTLWQWHGGEYDEGTPTFGADSPFLVQADAVLALFRRGAAR